MNMFAPKVAVQAPARSPLPFGLFSVFQPQNSADRWVAGGVAWESLSCTPAVGHPISSTLDTPVHEFSGGRVVEGSARPFTVSGYFEGSLMTSTETDGQALAEEKLLLDEQRRVEQAFWLGDLENYPNLAGENLPETYSEATDLGTASAIEAVAQLENFVATEYGFQGVIHAPRHLASILASEGVIESRGGRMFTGLDTPVVAGAGYTGDQLKVTPPIFGYRSEVSTWTIPDTQQNNLIAVASRDYILGFDPCGFAEITVQGDSA